MAFLLGNYNVVRRCNEIAIYKFHGSGWIYIAFNVSYNDFDSELKIQKLIKQYELLS